MANPDVIKFYQEFSSTNLPSTFQSILLLFTFSIIEDSVVTPQVPANYSSFTGFPFSVGYAASSKSKCRGCNENIEQGMLRIGKMIQSKNFDGVFF